MTETTRPHLVHLTRAVSEDGDLAGRLLDSNRLACTCCGQRPAESIRGVYGDVALCASCEAGMPVSELAGNFGEFPDAGC